MLFPSLVPSSLSPSVALTLNTTSPLLFFSVPAVFVPVVVDDDASDDEDDGDANDVVVVAVLVVAALLLRCACAREKKLAGLVIIIVFKVISFTARRSTEYVFLPSF